MAHGLKDWTRGVWQAMSFINLEDTPGAYTGAGGQVVRVNAAENSLEFGTVISDEIHDADGDTYIKTELNADEDIIRAGAANQEIFRGYPSGNFELVKQSACRVHTSVNLDIAGGTWTKVRFDVVDEDVQSEFDPDTNYRFTANEAGIYLVVLALWVTQAGGYIAYASIYKNGIQVSLSEQLWPFTEYQSIVDVARISLAAGDYLEAYFYHNYSDTARIHAAAVGTYMHIMRIA